MSGISHAVFISYASQDAEAAQRICEALRSAEFSSLLLACPKAAGPDGPVIGRYPFETVRQPLVAICEQPEVGDSPSVQQQGDEVPKLIRHVAVVGIGHGATSMLSASRV